MILGNGLVLIRQLAITWNDDDQVLCGNLALLALSELTQMPLGDAVVILKV